MNSGKTYLLADDDEDDRLLFSDAFHEVAKSCALHVVNDGGFLMDFLQNNDNINPEAIFIDLNMPRKDGFQCIKEIRSNKQFNTVRLVVFSTSAQYQSIQRAKELGANLYVQKPSTYQELKSLVNKVVNGCLTTDDFLIKPE